ncbi:hypothetical protein CDCA_CDCA11G3260 [Cyanidium caldarium]|uniref:EamA domain-containing protein n=1 Tax=Cyanidium caldarium TaxID=2771 RepID=A0AAV9IYR5_CYACA|nr:hypothetical protein CDCA_CDCA11G3260 [Cyanidium caldarium]
MTRARVLGIVLVVAVAFIWVASSELMQFIFGDNHYDKPYLLTSVSQSLFVLYLLPAASRRCRERLTGGALASAEPAATHPPPSDKGSAAALAEGAVPTTPPGRGAAAVTSVPNARRAALYIAPLWFASNYSFNLSLTWTSVASSSSLSALSCLFALIVGALVGVELFTRIKLAAVLCTIGGAVLISTMDALRRGTNTFAGDALCVGSALLYALQTALIKSMLGADELADTMAFLGWLGVFSMLLSWPGLLILQLTSLEIFQLPDNRTAALIVLNGLIGTVLSDYLWARSVLLTSPLIASLALSLTIPLSALADMLFRHARFTWQYALGLFAMTAGFILASSPGHTESSELAERSVALPDGAPASDASCHNGSPELVGATLSRADASSTVRDGYGRCVGTAQV